MKDQKTDLKRLQSATVLQDIQNHPLRGLPIMSGLETQQQRTDWLQQLRSNPKLSSLYTKSPEEVNVRERN